MTSGQTTTQDISMINPNDISTINPNDISTINPNDIRSNNYTRHQYDQP